MEPREIPARQIGRWLYSAGFVLLVLGLGSWVAGYPFIGENLPQLALLMLLIALILCL